MNRRSFLSSAIASVAALAIDPERLLWVPGAKKIFIPPSRSLVLLPAIDLLHFRQGDFITISSWVGRNPHTGMPTFQQFVVHMSKDGTTEIETLNNARWPQIRSPVPLETHGRAKYQLPHRAILD